MGLQNLIFRRNKWSGLTPLLSLSYPIAAFLPKTTIAYARTVVRWQILGAEMLVRIAIPEFHTILIDVARLTKSRPCQLVFCQLS